MVLGDVLAGEVHRPADRVHQSRYRFEERRLPGAVGAEERDELALPDLEVDAEQHLRLVVGDAQVAHHQQQVGAGAQPLGPQLGGGLEHLQGVVGVVLHEAVRRAQDQAADDPERHRRDEAPPDAVVVGHPGHAGEDEQEPHTGDDEHVAEAVRQGPDPRR